MRLTPRIILAGLFVSCVLFAEPPTRLSETGLYDDIAAKKVSDANIYFEPQYPLWTDGATKLRWIWIPPGKKVDNSNPDHWLFPVGTKAWKEFSFPDPENSGHYRRVETRYYRKTRVDGWWAASFVWNKEETEATRAPEEGIADYYPLKEGKYHSIPAVRQCWDCHYKGGDPILGFEALQLSTERDPLALHKRKDDWITITNKELIEKNLLLFPGDLLTNPPRIHAQTDKGRAAMGYLHANCGHCHNPTGPAAGTGQFLRHTLSSTNQLSEQAFKTTVNVLTKSFQIPDQDETYRILPKYPDLSAVHYRLSTGSMPPLGVNIVDQEAIEQLEAWIKTIQE